MSSLSFQICAFLPSLYFVFIEWKEKQLEKMSISLSSGENSLLKGLNKGKTLLSLLLELTMDPLTFNHCLGVNFLSNKQ